MGLCSGLKHKHKNLGPKLDSQGGGDKGVLLSKARLKCTGKHRNVRAASTATEHWSFGSVVLVLQVLVEVLRSRRADGLPAGKGERKCENFYRASRRLRGVCLL